MTSPPAPTLINQASWWLRPAGGREVLTVALPLVVSTISWTVMTFADRMFLNWVSETAMSAAFSSSIIWFAVFCLPMGICSYVNTFVSQYHGNQQPERIGSSVWQGIWLALLITPLAVIAVPLAPWIFSWTRHEPAIMGQEILYFQVLCTSGPALLIATALSAFYSGRGKTWVVMLVDAFVSCVNLVLDYLWIFGYAGFPEMGIAGAGWATVTALWLKAIIYFVLFMRGENRMKFLTLAGAKLDRELFGRLLYFGGPSGVQILLDVLGFTVFIVLMGRVGPMESAATTLAFSIASVAFMPIWGLSMAVTVLVGQHLGENRDDLASRATWTSLHISIAYIGFISVLYVFTPDLFLSGFFTGNAAAAGEKAAPAHHGSQPAAVRGRLQPNGRDVYDLRLCGQRSRRHPLCHDRERVDGHPAGNAQLADHRRLAAQHLWLLDGGHRLGLRDGRDFPHPLPRRQVAQHARHRAACHSRAHTARPCYTCRAVDPRTRGQVTHLLTSQ